jgi:hypothetical protein
VYTWAFRGASSKSEMSGKGYRSFFVMLLSPWKSTQSLRELSFFFTKSTGAPWVDELGWMKPIQRFSLMKLWSALSLGGERE